MKDTLSNRIQILEKELEASASRHNSLVGMLMEAKHILELAKKDHKDIEEVIYTTEE